MIDKILEDREKRYNLVIDMINKYSFPVLCGKINYPGTDKNTPEANIAFEAIKETVEKAFEQFFLDKKLDSGFDGNSIIASLKLDPDAAKRIAVRLEEVHALGRIFDIDIYGVDGVPFSRTDLDLSPRKCIVCGENARECIWLKKHGIEEILNCINEMIKQY